VFVIAMIFAVSPKPAAAIIISRQYPFNLGLEITPQQQSIPTFSDTCNQAVFPSQPIALILQVFVQQ